MPTNHGDPLGRDAQKEALERAPPAQPHSRSFAVLAIAVLGVVYGDIGTSPLYALRETFDGTNPVPVSPNNVLGVLSLIFWTLIVIVSIKYMIFVLRADNRGEGGTFALMALLNPDRDQDRFGRSDEGGATSRDLAGLQARATRR